MAGLELGGVPGLPLGSLLGEALGLLALGVVLGDGLGPVIEEVLGLLHSICWLLPSFSCNNYNKNNKDNNM